MNFGSLLVQFLGQRQLGSRQMPLQPTVCPAGRITGRFYDKGEDFMVAKPTSASGQPSPQVLCRGEANAHAAPGKNTSPTHPSPRSRTCWSSSRAANGGVRETQAEATCNFTARVRCVDLPQALWNQEMVQSCPVSNVRRKTSSWTFFLKPQSREPCNYLLTELSVLFFKVLAPRNCRKSLKHYSRAPNSLKKKASRNNPIVALFLKEITHFEST